MDQADDVWPLHLLECVAEQSPRTFSRQSLPLKLWRESPSQLEPRSSGAIRISNSSGKFAGFFVLRSEVSVPSEVPMSDRIRHVSPRFHDVECLAAEEAHDIGICAHRCLLLQLILPEHSEDK